MNLGIISIRRQVLGFAGILAFTHACLGVWPPYSVTDLGTLGGDVSYAFGLNESGQVVGSSQPKDLGFGLPPLPHAFFWEKQTGMTNLGVVGLDVLGHSSSMAVDIAENGDVLANSFLSIAAPFLWAANSGMDPLMPVVEGGWIAQSLNDHGTVVGWEPSRRTAYRWDETNGWREISGMSGAFGINDSGMIVGEGDYGQAVWFDGGNELIPLGALMGDEYSRALDINDIGEVVGWSGSGERCSILPECTVQSQSAFIWRIGIMDELPALPAPYLHAQANAINRFGMVVGSAFTETFRSDQRAVLWHGGQSYDLNDLIDPESPWILQSAEDINDRGQIVGYGLMQDQPRAFLLDPLPRILVLSITMDRDELILSWRHGFNPVIVQFQETMDPGGPWENLSEPLWHPVDTEVEFRLPQEAGSGFYRLFTDLD